MLRKGLVLFFSLILVVGLFVFLPRRAQASSYFGSCGEALEWEFDPSSGHLSITGSGEMNSAPWQSYCPSIRSVSIGEGVTSVTDHAFDHCSDLESVVIGNSVETIGEAAFYQCTGLTAVSIPENTRSIGAGAFRGCYRLTSVYIPAKVESIGEAAFCAANLSEITVSPANIVYHSQNNCLIHTQSKTLIVGTGGSVIPANGSVTSIADLAFCACYSLTSITIPGSVITIGNSAFYECEKLASVTIENGVRIIGDLAFSECRDLVSLSLGNTVTEIGAGAFSACSYDLGYSVVIPDSVKTIGASAFESIGRDSRHRESGLTSVTIGKGVETIGDYAFMNCGLLSSIVIPGNVKSIGYRAFCRSELTSVTMQNGLTRIDVEAFYDCRSLSSVSIPDTVEKIGLRAFGECPELAFNRFDYAKYLGNSENPYVVLMGPGSGAITSCRIHPDTRIINDYAFQYCEDLASISIPDSVKMIGARAFYNCTGLASVTVGSGVESVGEYAFYMEEPSSLKKVIVADLASWCGIEFAGEFSNPLYYAHRLYLGDTFLADLVIPEGVKSVGAYAFCGCTGLIAVSVPSSMEKIGVGAFAECDSLEAAYYAGPSRDAITIQAGNDCLLNLPLKYWPTNDLYGSWGDGFNWYFDVLSGVLTISGSGPMPNYDSSSPAPWHGFPRTVIIEPGVTTIGNSAFSECYFLTSVSIPDSVRTIGFDAFYVCGSLSSLTIPLSVKTIKVSAFAGCKNLVTVYYPGTVEERNEIAIGSTNTRLTGAEWIYMSGLQSVAVATLPTKTNYLLKEAFSPEGLALVCHWSDGPDTVVTVGFSCSSPDMMTPGDKTVTVTYQGRSCNFTIKVTEIGGTCGDNLKWTFDPVSGVLSITGSGAMDDYPSDFSSPWNSFRTSILAVVIGSGVTRIGNNAFILYEGLESITLPDSVISVGDHAFEACKWVTSVRFGGYVTAIGYGAFGGCKSLESVVFAGSESEWNAVSVGLANEPLLAASIRFEKESDPGEDPEPDGAWIEWESEPVRAGETVEVYIVLYNAPDLDSLSVSDIIFDSSVLTLEDVEWLVPDMALHSFNTSSGKGVAAFSVKNVNGRILKLTFTVSSDAEDGDYSVSCTVSGRIGSKTVEAETLPGKITVKNETPGDLDHDEEVTAADAIYLLYYTFFPEDFPIRQAVDFNRDGEVTAADAIYLLYFTFFPEDFPLT